MKLLTVLMAVVAGASGGEDCAEPGRWSCKVDLTGGDCPDGSIARSWWRPMDVAEEGVCGKTMVYETKHDDDGCLIECNVDANGQPGLITGTAACTLMCPTSCTSCASQLCHYTISVACSPCPHGSCTWPL